MSNRNTTLRLRGFEEHSARSFASALDYIADHVQEDSTQHPGQVERKKIHDINRLSQYELQVEIRSPDQDAKQDEKMPCSMQGIFLFRRYAQLPAGNGTQPRSTNHTDQMKGKEEQEDWLLPNRAEKNKRRPGQDAQPDQDRPEALAHHHTVDCSLFCYHVLNVSSTTLSVAAITFS